MSGLTLYTETPVLPLGMGQQMVLGAFEEKSNLFIHKAIKLVLTHRFLPTIKQASEINLPISQACLNIDALPESPTRQRLSQQMRFLILIIYNRMEQLPAKEIRESVKKSLQVASKLIGSVPKLNEQVQQPDNPFKTKQYKKTIQKWKNTRWVRPSKTSDKEKLMFFTKKDKDGRTIASVRQHLLAVDGNVDQSRTQPEALSYADGDFYAHGALQVDHLQASEDIVYRQLELITAMNLDPLFGKKMKEEDNQGYFIEGENKKFYGSKKFFLDYHNCVDNLWLTSTTTKHTEMGKGQQEIVKWLEKQSQYGKSFFDEIGGKESICKDSILYTTQNGIILCSAAKHWFHKTYAEEMKQSGYMLYNVKKPAAKMISEAKQSTKKKLSDQTTRLIRSNKKIKQTDKIKAATSLTLKKRKRALVEEKKSDHSRDSDTYQKIPSPFTTFNSPNIKAPEKNRYAMFQPAAQTTRSPRLKEEKMLEQILWRQSEQKIRKSLVKKLGREPSAEDIKNVFQLVMKAMREEGVIKKILDRYLQEKIDRERAQAGTTSLGPSK